MVNFSEITPGEYKAASKNFKILYGQHDTDFGPCVIGLKSPENAVCYFHFVNETIGKGLEDLKVQWPQAQLTEEPEETENFVKKIIAYDHEDIMVLLMGTDFQIKVWKALTTIPLGKTVNYDYIGNEVNSPKAIQAISKIIGANRVALLIPCHRTLPKSGNLPKSCWRTEKRPILLKYEKNLSEQKKSRLKYETCIDESAKVQKTTKI